jgi:type IV fimbrial biogenesis protein FimT
MQKQQSGFTVIELMVTLIVAAILAVIAAPSFRDLIIKSRLRGATDDIVALLNNARGSAVKLERQINVSLQGTTSWCAGAITEAGPASVGAAATLSSTACDCAGASAATSCVVDNQSTLLSSSNYSGVQLSSLTGSIDFASGGVTFDPKAGALTSMLNGTFSSPGPSVTITSGLYQSKITVSPLGQTVVCTPAGSPFVSGYPSC